MGKKIEGPVVSHEGFLLIPSLADIFNIDVKDIVELYRRVTDKLARNKKGICFQKIARTTLNEARQLKKEKRKHPIMKTILNSIGQPKANHATRIKITKILTKMIKKGIKPIIELTPWKPKTKQGEKIFSRLEPKIII